MNIFAVNKDPKVAAQELCDQHVVKMIVETAQMLYTAHWVLDGSVPVNGLKPYRKTHANHPCSKWARESDMNYKWLYEHGVALCEEFTKRFNKTHKTSSHFWCTLHTIPNNIPIGELTPFEICIKKSDPVLTDMCTIPGDPIRSYHLFYNLDKVRFARWRYTEKPSWLWKNISLDYT